MTNTKTNNSANQQKYFGAHTHTVLSSTHSQNSQGSSVAQLFKQQPCHWETPGDDIVISGWGSIGAQLVSLSLSELGGPPSLPCSMMPASVGAY